MPLIGYFVDTVVPIRFLLTPSVRASPLTLSVRARISVFSDSSCINNDRFYRVVRCIMLGCYNGFNNNINNIVEGRIAHIVDTCYCPVNGDSGRQTGIATDDWDSNGHLLSNSCVSRILGNAFQTTLINILQEIKPLSVATVSWKIKRICQTYYQSMRERDSNLSFSVDPNKFTVEHWHANVQRFTPSVACQCSTIHPIRINIGMPIQRFHRSFNQC